MLCMYINKQTFLLKGVSKGFISISIYKIIMVNFYLCSAFMTNEPDQINYSFRI